MTVLTCVLLVILLAIVIVWRKERTEIVAPKQPTLCYGLDKFVSVKATETCPQGLKTHVIGEKTVCCGIASYILDNLIVEAVSERYDSEANPEFLALNLTDFYCDAVKTRTPVIKIVGISNKTKSASVVEPSKIYWNSSIPSHSTSSLKYFHDDGTIHVTSSGYYFVTSLIRFKLAPSNTTDDVTETTFRHSLKLISNGGKTSTILENVKSRCEMASEISEFTSNVGAVFNLKAGERLYVATSHPHILAEDEHSYISVHGIS